MRFDSAFVALLPFIVSLVTAVEPQSSEQHQCVTGTESTCVAVTESAAILQTKRADHQQIQRKAIRANTDTRFMCDNTATDDGLSQIHGKWIHLQGVQKNGSVGGYIALDADGWLNLNGAKADKYASFHAQVDGSKVTFVTCNGTLLTAATSSNGKWGQRFSTDDPLGNRRRWVSASQKIFSEGALLKAECDSNDNAWLFRVDVSWDDYLTHAGDKPGVLDMCEGGCGWWGTEWKIRFVITEAATSERCPVRWAPEKDTFTASALSTYWAHLRSKDGYYIGLDATTGELKADKTCMSDQTAISISELAGDKFVFSHNGKYIEAGPGNGGEARLLDSGGDNAQFSVYRRFGRKYLFWSDSQNRWLGIKEDGSAEVVASVGWWFPRPWGPEEFTMTRGLCYTGNDPNVQLRNDTLFFLKSITPFNISQYSVIDAVTYFASSASAVTTVVGAAVGPIKTYADVADDVKDNLISIAQLGDNILSWLRGEVPGAAAEYVYQWMKSQLESTTATYLFGQLSNAVGLGELVSNAWEAIDLTIDHFQTRDLVDGVRSGVPVTIIQSVRDQIALNGLTAGAQALVEVVRLVALPSGATLLFDAVKALLESLIQAFYFFHDLYKLTGIVDDAQTQWTANLSAERCSFQCWFMDVIEDMPVIASYVLAMNTTGDIGNFLSATTIDGDSISDAELVNNQQAFNTLQENAKTFAKDHSLKFSVLSGKKFPSKSATSDPDIMSEITTIRS